MKIDLENLTVILSKNSFHYRFMKFILGKMMPELNTLCPYFWLFWFCVIVSPVVMPIKLLWMGLSKSLEWIDDNFLVPAFDKWLESIEKDPARFANLWEEKNKAPFVFSSYKKMVLSRWNFEEYYMNKYNLNYLEYLNLIQKGEEEHREKRKAKLYAEIARKEKIDKFINKLVPKISFKLKIAPIVKWTKRFIGFIFTVALAYLLYLVGSCAIELLAKITMEQLQIFAKNLFILLSLVACIVGIVVALVYLISKYMNNFTNTWVGISVKFVWSFIKFLWKIIKAPFGFCWDYFKATKNDYCPGINWED
jgi:hypothetical protein